MTIKRILIELGIYTLLFVISLTAFPICNFYYLADDESMITKPQHFLDFEIAYVFPLYFLMVLFSFLSLKKGIIITVNIITLILTGLTFLFIQLGFAWWGASPFHPDLDYGYWFSHVILLVLIIRTFTLLEKVKSFNIKAPITRLFLALAILLPTLFIGTLVFSYNKAKNAPIMRSQWEHRVGNRIVKEESWDYLEAYHAFADKYYSTDTLRQEKFVLDSVRFTYFNDHSVIRKRFTQKAENGQLDVETILDDNY